jgi:tetratricopeptide (TPR) repeat protein
MTIRRLILALAVFCAVSAYGDQPPPRDLWPEVTTAARDGAIEKARTHAATMTDVGKAYGILTYPLYATTAAAMAREGAQQNRADLTQWGTSTAAILDPKSPAVEFAMADLAASKKNWVSAMNHAVRGLLRVPLNYRTNLLGRVDLMVVALIAILATAAVFALALFFRYGRSATHDLREILGTRLRGGSVTVLAFALLFLPLFLWLGPLWLIFYWFVVFFGYAAPVERFFIVLLCLLIAIIPVGLDQAAHLSAGIESPVVMVALSSQDAAYQPEALRRLQELSLLVPDNATIQVLLGNLQLFEGSEREAEEHYKKAIRINDSPGAHVNLGNLNFLQNAFPAAITEYERAQKLDPSLAIAFYNHSVASGELYKFDEQGQKLEAAKKLDRDLIEQYAQKPPAQKIVIYHPKLSEAWLVAESIGRKGTARSLFGNYSYFDPKVSVMNPVTLGALVALIASVVLWIVRKRNGYAGSCIKCGRTFCYRCKSARESATYCTQCIHIYLKRDGVSLDTKRAKLEEVSDYHSGMLKRNRLFASFLPGSAQALEGRTIAGFIGSYLFLFCVLLAFFIGRMAPAIGPIGSTTQMLLRAAAILVAIVIWLTLSLPVYRRRTTSA